MYRTHVLFLKLREILLDIVFKEVCLLFCFLPGGEQTFFLEKIGLCSRMKFYLFKLMYLFIIYLFFGHTVQCVVF